MNVNLRFEPPSAILEEFFWDRGPFSSIKGPLGSGKTQTVMMRLLVQMQEQSPNPQGVRPSRLFVVRNTYPDLLTTTIKDWAEVTRHIAPVKMGHPPTQLIKYALPDRTIVECDVIFIALDREEHVRKLRGTQGTVAWFNEMKELPYAVVEMMDARLGRYPSIPLGGVECDHAGIMVGDTNAPDEDHWYAKYEQEPPKNWKFYQQPGAVIKVEDQWIINPVAENIENLKEGYYDKLLQGKRQDWISVNLANEYGTAIDGKAIFPEFNRHIHVKEFETHPSLPIIFGTDFGLTPSLVMAQELDGQILVFDEIVTQNFSAEELSEAAKKKRGLEYPELKWGHGWGDPSNPRSQSDKNTPIQMMQAHNFNIIPAPTNDFNLRRDGVGKRLQTLTFTGDPAILIHPRCKILIKAMAGHYMYRRLKVAGDEKYHDVPDKNMFSHVAEALQYLSMGMGDADLLLGGDGYSEFTDWSVPVNKPMRRSHGRKSRRAH